MIRTFQGIKPTSAASAFIEETAVVIRAGVIGEDCIVGAGAVVTERTIVPPKSLILGAPAKVKRPVTEAELAWIRESAQNYVKYARQYLADPRKSRPGFKP